VREIERAKLVDLVAKLCIRANTHLPEDIEAKLRKSLETETSNLGRILLGQLIQNSDLAKETGLPICQDTGIAVVFVEFGNDVHFGFDVTDAINEGVARGYKDGYLRKSMLVNALDRRNTGDNTPAVIHFEPVTGETLKITVLPKGGGSENASRIAMLTPAQGKSGVIEFVTDIVRHNGPKSCPPLVIGVGLGGSFEECAYLAKKALISSTPPEFMELTKEILDACNKTNIGVNGLGGSTTVLDVKILGTGCHIATMPVAVNICCHACRHAEGEL
jgi:fumarate hydratase subunit alpha